MELTKEYFDEQLGQLKEQFKIFATKDDLQAFATKDDLKNFATKDDLKAFATKEDLKNELKAYATKYDLKAQTKELTEKLEGYTDAVAATVLEAVDVGFTGVNLKLDNLGRRLGHVEIDFTEMKKALHLS